MAFHEITIMDVWAVLRRWHSGEPISQISKALGYDRKTVRGYIHVAQNGGISRDRDLPPKDDVLKLLRQALSRRSRTRSARALLLPFVDELATLVKDNELCPKSAFTVLVERHDLHDRVSYTSFRRFLSEHLAEITPGLSTCRRDVDPGSELQVDYALLGNLFDPTENRLRRAYLFIGSLAYSRHKYAEVTFTQDQTSFVSSHLRMFAFFGGVPERLVPDNLKAGVLKPDLYNPSFNHTYREMAEHFGCFIDPARVAHPRDKAIVERDVRTVRDSVKQFLALNATASPALVNRFLRDWLSNVYGVRKHGSTQEQPFTVFTERELPRLKPLPPEPFELATWKEATVHPDHYVQFQRTTYAVPTAYIGRKVWVRSTERLVQIFFQENLIKQYLRSPGQRRYTDPSVFPANVRAVLDQGLWKQLLVRAESVGPNFHHLVRDLLQIHAYMNLRRVHGLLRLSEHHEAALIERAALIIRTHRLSPHPDQFRQLLHKLRLELPPSPAIPLSADSLEFVRDITYFIKDQGVST